MNKLKVFIIFVFFSGILTCSILLGLTISGYKMLPHKYITKLQKRILEATSEANDGGMRILNKRYSSTFVSLRDVSVNVPVSRKGYGGALTSMNDFVILITHEGIIFSATTPTDVDQLDIHAPENNYQAYLMASVRPPYDSYIHRPNRMRYNDILYFENDNDHGLLVSYTRFNPEKICCTNALSKLNIDHNITSPIDISANSEYWELLYESVPCLPFKTQYRAMEGHMAGGRIAFDDNDKVFLANGEYHWDGIYASKAIAQDMDYDYGKVVSIDVNSGAYVKLTSGQRNMQGIVIDNDDRLWTVEHGIRSGDELNLIKEGKDYGYPAETLGTLYSGLPVPNTLYFWSS